MANPWKVGSWAEDSEAAAVAAPPAPLAEEAFPTLGEAKKTKKKKPQTVSLNELHAGKYVGPGGKRSTFNDREGLTSDEMLLLPTGPRERTEEEKQESGRLGGGFRDYGRDREGRDYGNRERRGDRGDRDRERGFGFDREDSSRADESSDWSTNKPARGERGGGRGFDDDRRFGGDRDMPSKADEADSWTSGKKFVPTERRDDFGRGFGKADADDNWGANKRSSAAPPDNNSSNSRWSFRRSEDGPGPEGDRWGKRTDDPPSEARRGGDEPRRPRLNLQPRTLPVDTATLPPSNHSSRPGTPEEVSGDAKPRKKVDPFGSARPREVLLEERGEDWRKMDMKLEKLENKRAEDDSERKLKEEISSLKEAFESTGEPAIKEQIAEKEQELEELSKELDSKARVSDSWRKDDPPARKEEAGKKVAPGPEEVEKKPAAEENAWKKGGNPWKRENGRDRAKVDRW